jgi:exosortase/archaeosortase family protein
LELPALSGVVAGIGRRELLLWVVICLFANQALQLLDIGSYEAFAASLAAQNIIYWLACYAVIYRLGGSDGAHPANRLDCFLASAICVSIFFTSFLPYRFGVGFLTTMTAGYLLLVNRGDRNLSAAGGVLLAISAHQLWGPVLFQLLTPELLRADAALVGEVLASLRPDIIWSGTSFHAPDGHSILLVGGCSSFNNVSTAVLACATVAMLRRTEWVQRDIATLAVACLVMILVNTARLCLLAWSGPQYLFWHNGAGVQILGIAQTLLVLLIAWWGAAPPGRRMA